jgi:hypothetical protein
MAISQSIMPDNIGPAKSLLTLWWPAQMSACIGLHVLACIFWPACFGLSQCPHVLQLHRKASPANLGITPPTG